MIICFNCTPVSKRELDKLLKQGDYQDYSEIINLAISNLSILQNKIDDNDSVIIDQQIHSIRAISEHSREMDYSSKRMPDIVTEKVPTIIEIPEVFRVITKKDYQPTIAPSSIASTDTEKLYQIQNWIFGQFNRFLPLKATCRGIANITQAEAPSGATLSAILSSIPSKATDLGNYLTICDNTQSLKRDDYISIAFPSYGPNKEKSELRFANQFVASVDKTGNLSGMPFEFGFINWIGESGSEIALTEQGWSFSQLLNPVLDGNQKSPGQKFSKIELEFLIQHIISNIPPERLAYRSIIQGINKGHDTPVELGNFLEKDLSPNQRENYSDAFLSTQRSGVISRMIDLELINRVRKGKYVQYTITDFANDQNELLKETSL